MKKKRAAFSLVEVTLALGIAAFCLLAIFGLLPTGLNSNQTSIHQTVASGLASMLVTDLRATPKAAPGTTTAYKSPRFLIPIPAFGNATHTLFLKEDGSISGTIDQSANGLSSPLYRAMLEFKGPALRTPPNQMDKRAMTVRVLITWPALADSTANTIPTKFAGSFETVTTLDRN